MQQDYVKSGEDDHQMTREIKTKIRHELSSEACTRWAEEILSICVDTTIKWMARARLSEVKREVRHEPRDHSVHR